MSCTDERTCLWLYTDNGYNKSMKSAGNKNSSSLIILLTLFVLFTNIHLSARDSWDDVTRIVAIGDIHGDYTQMFSLLKSTGLIDKSGNWIGGTTHLVQTGDIPDRGPDTAKIITFFMRLEKQARRKGGYVHMLIGNHEAMNMIGDLRYVIPEEYAALKTRKSAQLRDRYYAGSIQWMKANLPPESMPVFDEAHRAQWDLKYPLGYVEHRRAWSANGEFGSWVAKHNAVIRINNILFMHGGLGPAFAETSLKQLNSSVLQALQDVGSITTTSKTVLEHEEGPLWYRGLAQHEQQSERAHLDSLLQAHQVQHLVLGHTVTEGSIKPRFKGAVILIDTGMSAHYGSHAAALLIEDNNFFAVQRGQKIPLPFSGDALIAYYEAVAALEPDSARLDRYIATLKQAGVPVVEEEVNKVVEKAGIQ